MSNKAASSSSSSVLPCAAVVDLPAPFFDPDRKRWGIRLFSFGDDVRCSGGKDCACPVCKGESMFPRWGAGRKHAEELRAAIMGGWMIKKVTFVCGDMECSANEIRDGRFGMPGWSKTQKVGAGASFRFPDGQIRSASDCARMSLEGHEIIFPLGRDKGVECDPKGTVVVKFLADGDKPERFVNGRRVS